MGDSNFGVLGILGEISNGSKPTLEKKKDKKKKKDEVKANSDDFSDILSNANPSGNGGRNSDIATCKNIPTLKFCTHIRNMTIIKCISFFGVLRGLF